ALGRIGGRLVARPLGRGAGALTTVVRADGFLRVPAGIAAVALGEEAEIELLRPLAEAERTVLVAGIDDPVLGVLEDLLRREAPAARLVTARGGARAGLDLLASGGAHVALAERAV